MDAATTLPFEPAGDMATAAMPSPEPVLKLPFEENFSAEPKQPKIEEISDDDVEMPAQAEAGSEALEPSSETGRENDPPKELETCNDTSSRPACGPSSPALVEDAHPPGPSASAAKDGLDVAIAAEASSLAEPLQSPEEDLRKKQLAFKAQNREAAAAKKKQQEFEKEQEAAAKAEKKRLREEVKAAKAAAKKLKNRKSASKEDKVDPSPEKPMDVEADLEDDVSEPVADGEGEDEAAAEEVEAVETEVKKKRRRVASPKAKGSSSNPGFSSAAAAASSSTPAADDNAKKPKTIRRGGQSDVINKSLVQELSIFMKQWRTVSYKKDEHTVHKDVPGMTPYWSRDAAGIKMEKEAGSGKFQACYFALRLDKCSSMAVNLYLAKKFQEKCAAEAPGWAEGSEAGVHYGILARSAKAAHDKLI